MWSSAAFTEGANTSFALINPRFAAISPNVVTNVCPHIAIYRSICTLYMRALTICAGIALLLGVVYLAIPDSPPAPPDFPKNNPEARALWEFERTRDPATGHVPAGIRGEELAFARKMAALAPMKQAANTWEPVGPDTLGGRTRALAIDVTDENTMIAGAVSGGIWKTTNGGQSWTQTLNSTQLLSITALAQDTRSGNTDTWYAGTGEISGNSASGGSAPYRGDGIYKSTDGGDSWTLLSSTSSDLPQFFDKDMDYVWRIVTDASNPSQEEVYAAVYSGIYRSVDGGSTWTEVLGNSNATYTDVVISSTGVLYAALSHPGTNAGVWRSEDGENWTNITPAGWSANSARTTLALAPSNEDVMYTITNSPGAGTHDHSLWKYTHSTSTWEDRSANVPGFGSFSNGVFTSQGGYDLLIAVKPDDEDVVFIGGTSLYRSTDGFASTNTSWIAGYSGETDDWSGTHHADQHIVIFPPSDPGAMYTGSDGGIHYTANNLAAEVAWTSLNRGYVSGQFYTVAVDHTSDFNQGLIGGTQDNGTWYVDDPFISILGEQIWGGDGAYSALLNEGQLRYASFQNGQIYRLAFNVSDQLTSWALVTPGLESSYLFIHPFILDPNDSDIMYLPGNQRMLRNTALSSIPDFQSSVHTIGWQELSNTYISGGGVISSVDVSTANPTHRVYYGTSAGKVYRIDDAHTGDPAAVDVTSSSFPSGGYVSSIAVHPDNGDQVAVVFSNYSVQSVFYSSDAGATWTNVSGSLEENEDGSGSGPSVRWIEMAAVSGAGTQYFVGTSTGLYSTSQLDGTATVWTQEGSATIGNVVVDMIDIRQSDGYVAIGTHGNGLYTTTLEAPVLDTAPGGVATGLAWWLKADAGVTTSNNAVSAWADQSLEGYDLGGTHSKPDYASNAINYNPAVAFTGNDHSLDNASTNALHTVFIVQKPTGFGASQDDAVLGVNDADRGYLFRRSGSTNEYASASNAPSNDFLGAARRNGSTSFSGTISFDQVDLVSGETNSGGVQTESWNIGHIGSTNTSLLAEVPEVVAYSGALSNSDRDKVESYLAIKYGITLGHDYVASNGSSLWDIDASPSFNNDIAGIGRDDASGLNQKQSSGDILSVGLGTVAADNASNAHTFSGDVSFLMWGHNNGNLTESDVMFGDADAKLLSRTWFVKQKGTNNAVEVRFDLSGVTVTGTEASDFWLVLDTDTDPLTDQRFMVQATSFASNIVSFSDITLENNDYISLVTDNPDDVTLPVELIHVEAVYDDGQVHVTWSTASETNNAGFEVQRREHDEWLTRAFVEGQGNTTQQADYTFIDNVQAMNGRTLTYRLKQIDFDGGFAWSDEMRVELPAPKGYTLSAYPNPFNPVTTIQYDVPVTGHVTVTVFDVQGRRVKTLINQPQAAGRHEVQFDASGLATGTYIYRLESAGQVLTNSFMLVK